MEQADGYLLAGMVASCRSPKQDPNSKTIIYIYILYYGYIKPAHRTLPKRD